MTTDPMFSEEVKEAPCGAHASGEFDPTCPRCKTRYIQLLEERVRQAEGGSA